MYNSVWLISTLYIMSDMLLILNNTFNTFYPLILVFINEILLAPYYAHNPIGKLKFNILLYIFINFINLIKGSLSHKSENLNMSLSNTSESISILNVSFLISTYFSAFFDMHMFP